MASKRRPPLSPDMSDYLGLDAQGRHALAWPSCSRPGVRHFTLGVYNRALSCTCEAYIYHPERPCLHMLAYPDALRHHLDPPPADPGGAAAFLPCRHCPPCDSCETFGCRVFDDHPADPSGVALDSAQADADVEIGEWLPAALRDHMRRRFDEAVAADGDRWIQSRTEAGVRLTCVACHAVRGWASEGLATAWLEGGGRCGCGGPSPPARGAARKPLDGCLQDLYGG